MNPTQPRRDLPPPAPMGLRTGILLALLGFASGLPLYLTGSTLKAWMTDEQLSLATIGLFSYATLPYSLKVIWAPLLDRYSLPFFGRRRGWMLMMQGGMAAALGALAVRDPHMGLVPIAGLAVAVAFTSATFDIAVDAWRAEALEPAYFGFGSSIHITGYRVAMLTSGGLALILAQHTSWRFTFLAMAGLTLLGMIPTFLAPSTDERAPAPRSLGEAIIEPLHDLLQRPRISMLLAFTIFYKLGDWLADAMTMPFLMRGIGFTKVQIGSVQKTTALVAILLGGLVGGWLLTRVRLRSVLWICGIAQATSILGFWAISLLGRHLVLLIIANTLENFAFGMGGSAFAALLMGSVNLKYTGTQYALFSALMALPRTFFAGFTGFLAERVGWTLYFPICALAALPGFILLVFYDQWGLPEEDLKG